MRTRRRRASDSSPKPPSRRQPTRDASSRPTAAAAPAASVRAHLSRSWLVFWMLGADIAAVCFRPDVDRKSGNEREHDDVQRYAPGISARLCHEIGRQERCRSTRQNGAKLAGKGEAAKTHAWSEQFRKIGSLRAKHASDADRGCANESQPNQHRLLSFAKHEKRKRPCCRKQRRPKIDRPSPNSIGQG